MGPPIVLLVDDDTLVLDELAADLRHRFSVGFQVLAEADPLAALALLRRVGDQAQQVALVFAGQQMTPLSGVEFLARIRPLHPAAKRILRLPRGDYTAANPAVRAMTLGQIDYHLFTPWRPAERWLYPPVTDFLADWSKSQPPSFAAFRIVGRQWDVPSHQLRQVLTRMAVPYEFHAHDSAIGRALIEQAGQDGSRLPVVIFRTGRVLVDPSHHEIVELLGGSTRAPAADYDVVVVGAGPAGLAAAVSAASEGLRTLVVEPEVFGGQAGTSSLIRNYPGFPHGISGDDLAVRTFEQAWLFGTDFLFAQRVTGLASLGSQQLVTLSDGRQVTARTVLLALGVSWRRLNIANLQPLVGAGVCYGAAGSEVHAVQDADVFVIGGGNSAGQAAVHLAEHAATVTLLVRGAGLGATMSDYLINKIDATANIRVRSRTEVIDGGGSGRLEQLTLRDHQHGSTETVAAAALFVLIGAEPRTEWLGTVVARDVQGYVLTGRDVPVGVTSARSAARPPLFLETSLPGVFAAGDARHRSVKRVASAVGEGAVAVQLIHEYLSEVR